MTRAYFPEDTDHIAAISLNDAIAQADWLGQQSGYESVDDLWRSDPGLFMSLAAEWREEHPLAHLGG